MREPDRARRIALAVNELERVVLDRVLPWELSGVEVLAVMVEVQARMAKVILRGEWARARGEENQ